MTKMPKDMWRRRNAVAVVLAALFTACTYTVKNGEDGDEFTAVAPQVKIGLPQPGPTQYCSATVRYWFEGDEIDPGVPGRLDQWHVNYEDLVPIDFIPHGGGGATWHCVYGSPFAVRALPHEEGYADNLHYEVLSLIESGDVWDPAWLVLYSGQCYLEHEPYSSVSPLESYATNYVNFTTTQSGCVISTSPLSGFPGDSLP